MPRSAGLARAATILVTVGVMLLLISMVLVGRDVRFSRDEAEREVVAFAEASATAIQFAPPNEIVTYLAGLVKHPAIAAATVYSTGKRIIRRRPPGDEPPMFVPSLGDPILGCRAVGNLSLCVEADMNYYRRRVAALV